MSWPGFPCPPFQLRIVTGRVAKIQSDLAENAATIEAIKQEQAQMKAQLAAHSKAIKTLVTAVSKLEKKLLALEHMIARVKGELCQQIEELQVRMTEGTSDMHHLHIGTRTRFSHSTAPRIEYH